MTTYLNMPSSSNPVFIGRRESNLGNSASEYGRSPMLHPALSSSLSRSFGLNSPFSLSALSSSLTAMSSSPGFSSMAMSLGRSFEERPKLEAQFFRNFQCCGLDLQDLHGLLEHFEECHVMYDEDGNAAGMDATMDMGEDEPEGTVSGPPSPRMGSATGSSRGAFEVKKSALSSQFEPPDSPAQHPTHLDAGMELDMDMDDPEEEASAQSPAGSAHSSTGTASTSVATPNPTFGAAPMSAFDAPLPLAPSSSKNMFTSASAINPLVSTGTMRLGIGGIMGGLDAITNNRSSPSGFQPPESTVPDSPVNDETSTTTPASETVFPVPSSASAFPGSTVALAPSLLFPAATPVETPAPRPMSQYEITQAQIREAAAAAQAAQAQAEAEAQAQAQAQAQVKTPVRQGPQPEDEHDDDDEGEEEEEEEEEEEDEENDGYDLNAQILADGDRQTALTKALGVSSLSALPSALNPLGTGIQISPSGRPYTPPSEKPFKCSVPGCDKSYKQQNGLKYHRLHGHCNANATGPEGETKGEGKPYVCHVASCGKRYKNMNGLRYHYQHSGAHGALGLQMLAQGCHPPPQFPLGHKRAGQSMSSMTSPLMPMSPLSTTVSPSRDSSRSGSPSGMGLITRGCA